MVVVAGSEREKSPKKDTRGLRVLPCLIRNVKKNDQKGGSEEGESRTTLKDTVGEEGRKRRSLQGCCPHREWKKRNYRSIEKGFLKITKKKGRTFPN